MKECELKKVLEEWRSVGKRYGGAEREDEGSEKGGMGKGWVE